MSGYGKKYSFTLIELMVTAGVMAALLGLMLPAFRGMLRGNDVDESISTLKLGMAQAQSLAASQRRCVALILANDSDAGTWTSSAEDITLRAQWHRACFGGFRLAYVKLNSGNWEFESWVPDSVWKNIPNGARLVRINTNPPSATLSGAVTSTESPLSSELMAFSPAEPAKAPGNCALIFNRYGECANNSGSLYFTVAQAPLNGTDLTVDTVNHRSLKLNGFSGNVDYYEP